MDSNGTFAYIFLRRTILAPYLNAHVGTLYCGTDDGRPFYCRNRLGYPETMLMNDTTLVILVYTESRS